MRTRFRRCTETADTVPPDTHALLRKLLADRGPGDQGAGESVVGDCRGRLDIPNNVAWEQLAADAEYHGVAPLIAVAIAAPARTGHAVPDDVRRTFLALASRHRMAAGAREQCVDRLLAAFAASGITLILLKGAALAHLIYPSPALRPMADIDVLIDAADVERAVRVARDLDYVFADAHASRFAGRMHHLPPATTTQSGFPIALEIHVDTMSPNQADRLTLSTLAGRPQPFRRGSGPAGLALGHTDMLRHLCRHAFEPARQVRLIHLYDLWRYPAIFRDQIDWRLLAARFPHVIVALRLVAQVFPDGSWSGIDHLAAGSKRVPAGVGLGMLPLSEIAAADIGPAAKLAALFSPSAWWLHGFYGVPPEESLLACRTVRHPLMVARWLLARAAAAMSAGRKSSPVAARASRSGAMS
jgi:hypothetical protein